MYLELVFTDFPMHYVYGVSGPSLLIESVDSMVTCKGLQLEYKNHNIIINHNIMKHLASSMTGGEVPGITCCYCCSGGLQPFCFCFK